MRTLSRATAGMALILALGLLAAAGLAPTVAASYHGNGYVYLYDVHEAYGPGGIAEPTEDTDWQFYCQAPSYVALDDPGGYWNFTVYVDCIDTVGATSGATFKVYIYIFDGTTNLTANSGSIRVDNSTRVYGNISIASASYEVMAQNGSAALYIKLVNGTTPTTLKDYYAGPIRVDSYGFIGMAWMMIPLMMVLVVMSSLMAAMGNTVQQSRKSKSSGKSKKKR